ncbi:ATP/GTP-binding protein [Rhodococcus sp. Z13]|uniref:ATP/GTP-binding protein n=1 Tax=Rhodococcus sacchari TaxID=2962047 RepID=A0ACD4DK40_9NOCA|nr:ATP/GTP-binding protein [Rhodococcus sp. Z13]UYP20359.1 ATP/GTP-binding protein [Rhodococcus sp. Z13]
MPRRNRSRTGRAKGAREQEPRTFWGATVRTENGPAGAEDERFTVRTVPGSRATKPYRCPGCDHEIAPGTPHVVAWPTDVLGGAEDRRHWHNGCWSSRGTRRPTRRWS